jgi:hypothetical protein
MTDLEERVRDALHARAEKFTASPDAWERTTARAGRRAIRRQAHRPARQRWLTRFTPLAAAAAVLVIGAGSATLAETGGFGAALRHAGLETGGSPAPHATPSSAPHATPSSAPRATPPSGIDRGGVRGTPCAFPAINKEIPVAGVQISAKVTVNHVTTWWTRIPESMYPQAKTDLALCQMNDHGGSGEPESPLGQGQLVRASGPNNGLGGGTSMSGIAAGSVTSVEADLANGSVVRAGLAYGAGFPYAVWWLAYPQGIGATLVFRDAAGRVVKEIAEPYPSASALKHPVPLTPVSVAAVTGTATSCQQARIQQVMDGIKVWTYVGFTIPELVQPHHAKPTLCEVTGIVGAEPTFAGTYTIPAGQVARTFFVLNPTSSVSGVAAPGVTSVTAVLADGREYTGTFVNGKLFTYPVWLVSYPLKDPATLVFRNAAGAEVAVLHEPANPNP